LKIWSAHVRINVEFKYLIMKSSLGVTFILGHIIPTSHTLCHVVLYWEIKILIVNRKILNI